jgi:hypothetical protein
MPPDYFAYFDKLVQQSDPLVRTAKDIRRRESEIKVARPTVIPRRYHYVFDRWNFHVLPQELHNTLSKFFADHPHWRWVSAESVKVPFTTPDHKQIPAQLWTTTYRNTESHDRLSVGKTYANDQVVEQIITVQPAKRPIGL